MTHNATTPPSTSSPSSSPPATPLPRSRWARVWSASQFVVALAITLVFLAYLLIPDYVPHNAEPTARLPAANEIVQVVGPGHLRIQAGSPLDRKLDVVTARLETITEPLLTITGRVVASMRPGTDKNFWQFDTAELLTTHADWQKAQADIAFAETQLEAIKELDAARVEALTKSVERLTRLVAAGTDSAKDLAAEKANLRQTMIQGRKEIQEAKTAVFMAKRTEAALSRQLQQAGLEPELLRTATADMDIVVADVPEGKLSRAKVGQGCEAIFFGFPKQVFSGKVNSIAPVLSKERRSLRVLFVIHDPQDQLRPGMFAEIGLGTDPRETLLTSTEGILHIGRSDYALVAADETEWRVAEVQVGEPHNGSVEILEGLKPGDRVLGKGAILLKPLVVRSLQTPTAPPRESSAKTISRAPVETGR